MTTDETTAVFSSLLRRHRLDAGLTQEDLAERAGLSARGISDLEKVQVRAACWLTLAGRCYEEH